MVREAAGFTIAGYVTDPEAWADYILPQYRDAFALVGPLVVAGLVAVAAALIGPVRARLDRGALIAVLAAALLIAAAYCVTPYTAGGAPGEPTLVYADARYLVPALLLALVADRRRHRRRPLGHRSRSRRLAWWRSGTGSASPAQAS